MKSDRPRIAMPDADREMIVRLYESGMKWHLVRDQTGYSKSAVYAALRDTSKQYPNRGRKRGTSAPRRKRHKPVLRTEPWTMDEDCRLLRLWGWQRTHRTISQRLRRTLRDIRTRLHYLRETYGLTRMEAKFIEEGVLVVPKPKQTRSCLVCAAVFTSDGAHHRVCDRCKASPAWRDSVDDVSGYRPTDKPKGGH